MGKTALERHNSIVISGCSGSGKSSLLSELGRRGYRVYHEPGRQIVKEQLSIGGDGLPWCRADKFIMLVLSCAIDQAIDAASHDDVCFFDRSIIDALNHFLRHDLPVPPELSRAVKTYRYNPQVFMSPPWPEIYETDSERRHSFEDAVGEYESLLRTYPSLGYEMRRLCPPPACRLMFDFSTPPTHRCSRLFPDSRRLPQTAAAGVPKLQRCPQVPSYKSANPLIFLLACPSLEHAPCRSPFDSGDSLFDSPDSPDSPRLSDSPTL